jgi:hypothetical protein
VKLNLKKSEVAIVKAALSIFAEQGMDLADTMNDKGLYKVAVHYLNRTEAAENILDNIMKRELEGEVKL